MILLPHCVAIAGVIGSGKSTLGDKLKQRFNYMPIAFADPLKHAVQVIFNMETEDLWGESARRETPYKQFQTNGWCFPCRLQCTGPERYAEPPLMNLEEIAKWRAERRDWPNYWHCEQCGAYYPFWVTPREALKTLGTEWGRQFCSDVWITRTLTSMKEDHLYAITDCRFHNERLHVRAHGGVNILLLRGLEASTAPHPSEAEVRECGRDPQKHLIDIVVDNRACSAEETFDTCVNALRALVDGDVRRHCPVLPVAGPPALP